MGKRKILFLVLAVMFITGCSNNNLKKTSYDELNKLLENKETFILELMSNQCGACDDLEPRLKKVAKKYDIEVKYLDISKLSKKDYNNLTTAINFDGATPTIVFFNKGLEESMATRIIGSVDEDKLVNKFKDMGYIK